MNKSPVTGDGSKKGGLSLQTANKAPLETLARWTWLNYYNNYLREREIITEDEWRKMRRLIEQG